MRRTLVASVRTGWLYFILCPPLLIACSEQPPKDSYRFIEQIEVAGTCREDHVRPAPEYTGQYTGWIYHSFNITKNQDSVWMNLTGELSIEFPKRGKYSPPFSIVFWGLSGEEIVGDAFTLKGIAEHITMDEGDGEPEYAATCWLKVLRRLDHPLAIKESKVETTE